MNAAYRNTDRRRGQEGFSLVELIVATGVFAIGMVGVLGSTVTIMSNHRIDTIRYQANIEIQNQIQTLPLAANANANIFTLNVNSPVAIELAGLPGSWITLFIVKPDDPVTSMDETQLFSLPMDPSDVATHFPSGAPSPIEIVVEAMVPATNAAGNTLFYRYRVSALI